MTITWEQILAFLCEDQSMAVTSLLFIAFFVAVALVHYLLPRVLRPYFLLATSYGFFCYDPVNRPLVGVLLGATAVSWLCGLIIGKVKVKPVRVLALLVTQFVAFPSAIAYGRLSGRFGTKRMLLVAIGAYFCITLFAAFFLREAFEFWILAICVGLFQGGIQALSRSEFGKLIPKERSNEYYGFFDIFGRYASVMGTLLVSVVTSLTGNPSLGVLSIGILLVVGLVMLVKLSRMRGVA